jgi:hypothetical protein
MPPALAQRMIGRATERRTMQAIGEYLRSYIGDEVPDMPIGRQPAATPEAPPATVASDQPPPPRRSR